jgi:hypothetical protein
MGSAVFFFSVLRHNRTLHFWAAHRKVPRLGQNTSMWNLRTTDRQFHHDCIFDRIGSQWQSPSVDTSLHQLSSCLEYRCPTCIYGARSFQGAWDTYILCKATSWATMTLPISILAFRAVLPQLERLPRQARRRPSSRPSHSCRAGRHSAPRRSRIAGIMLVRTLGICFQTDDGPRCRPSGGAVAATPPAVRSAGGR